MVEEVTRAYLAVRFGGDFLSTDALKPFTSAQNYVDGTNSLTIEIIEDPGGTPDTTTIIVHEVLCVDVDDDGNLDFNAAVCDYREPLGSGGAIVSTVAPYNGDNIYLYILTVPHHLQVTKQVTPDRFS